jgi:hypothetical protein
MARNEPWPLLLQLSVFLDEQAILISGQDTNKNEEKLTNSKRDSQPSTASEFEQPNDARRL